MQIPKENDIFWECRLTTHCKVYGYSTVSCAKTAEQIEMPFRIKTRVGPRNRVLQGQIPQREGHF